VVARARQPAIRWSRRARNHVTASARRPASVIVNRTTVTDRPPARIVRGWMSASPPPGERGVVTDRRTAAIYCARRTLIARQSSAISKGLQSAAPGRATSCLSSSGCAVIRMIGT
jgi:hypothetical protein